MEMVPALALNEGICMSTIEKACFSVEKGKRRNPAAKPPVTVTDNQAVEILRLHRTKELPTSEIARRYGITTYTIYNMAAGRSRKHLTRVDTD